MFDPMMSQELTKLLMENKELQEKIVLLEKDNLSLREENEKLKLRLVETTATGT